MKTIVITLRNLGKATLLLATLSLLTPDSASAFGNVLPPTTPALLTPTPTSGPVGTQVEVSAILLNKDKNGNTWTGAPPYQIQFKGAGATFVNAAFTVVSPTLLRVTVPVGAVTGKIRLKQADYIKSTFQNFTVVAPVQPGTLRITNSSQYNLISVRVNNVETLNPGNVVPVGTFMNLPRQPGAVSVEVKLGISPADGPLFFFNRNLTVTSNTTVTFTAPRVTIAQLMTNFSAQKDWTSDLLLGSNGQFYLRTVRFLSNGQYRIIDSQNPNVAAESGIFTQITWANNSNSVTFRLGQRTVNIFFPFGSFLSTVDRGGRNILVTQQ